MAKKFEDIKITNDVLSTVGEFKAIVAPGRKRPILDKSSHGKLILKKYDDGAAMYEHVTLFRVKDKKTLPPKEIKEHTVQGPQWTPPSSVGFVMGAQSKAHRIWLATKPTDDKEGLLGKNSDPSIYARELTTAVSHGWTAREPKENETYGCTDRGPIVVLTPPSSPKFMRMTDLQKVLDINSDWNGFPISLSKLKRLSTPVYQRFKEFLEENKLDRDDFDDSLLEIVVNTKVLPLIEDGCLSLNELSETSYDTTRELLEDKEIIILLSEGALEYDELVSIYSEYIEDSDSSLGEFSFNKLYSLISSNQEEFSTLLFELNLNIDNIIKLYSDDYHMFCAFANDNAISFFQEYRAEIEMEYMIEIYHDNPDLFFALINDEEDVIQDLGIHDFIEQYEQAQCKIEEIPEDDPYNGAYSAYDMVRSWVIEDNCPDEFLLGNSSSDEEGYDW